MLLGAFRYIIFRRFYVFLHTLSVVIKCRLPTCFIVALVRLDVLYVTCLAIALATLVSLYCVTSVVLSLVIVMVSPSSCSVSESISLFVLKFELL